MNIVRVELLSVYHLKFPSITHAEPWQTTQHSIRIYNVMI